MKCLYCNFEDTQVIDTRISEDKTQIKRRRRCTNCDRRFNTLETIELQMPSIIKSNGAREEYQENKIRTSLVKALHKRPVPQLQVDNAIDNIRQQILNLGEREVSSAQVGDMVMQELSALDKVAYIRFASVYLSFKNATDFSQIIDQLHKEK
jgi:transcriptional repressor NrdR